MAEEPEGWWRWLRRFLPDPIRMLTTLFSKLMNTLRLK
jgi:hypothetical protein